MRIFAVSYVSFFDYDTVVEILEGNNIREVIRKHSKFNQPDTKNDYDLWLNELPENEEEIKQFFFDSDSLIGWVEIETCKTPQ